MTGASPISNSTQTFGERCTGEILRPASNANRSISPWDAGYPAGQPEMRFILGCNHPIWASLGLIHGSRSSNDIKRTWDRFKRPPVQNLKRNWQNGTALVERP